MDNVLFLARGKVQWQSLSSSLQGSFVGVFLLVLHAGQALTAHFVPRDMPVEEW